MMEEESDEELEEIHDSTDPRDNVSWKWKYAVLSESL
jgi:hypothetical protein